MSHPSSLALSLACAVGKSMGGSSGALYSIFLSAAAVDKMHDGERADYDKELRAQGLGNMVCGFLGAGAMAMLVKMVGETFLDWKFGRCSDD